MSIVGDNVRARRTALGWSQEKLAEQAGVSQTTIDKIEQGLTLRSRFLGDIAAALQADISELDPGFSRLRLKHKTLLETTSGQNQSELPLFISNRADENGYIYLTRTPVDVVPRPRIVDNSPDAFAVYIASEYMEPELYPGDVAIFDPRYPVLNDSTGIFKDRISTSDLHVIGRFVGSSDGNWQVRVWNANAEIHLPMERWSMACRMVAKHCKR